MPENFQFKIEETVKKARLDKFLFGQITTHSKIYLSNLIGKGECRVNGAAGLAGYHLKKDDVVEIAFDLSAVTSMKPEAISLKVVFEDDALIVIDKPAEMLVHPTLGQKNGTLLNALSYYLNKDLINSQAETKQNYSKFIRPGLVHRLDRQTSGLMVIAKTPESLSFLSNHFQRKIVKKKYIAVVEGEISEDSGTIGELIGYFEEQKSWNVKADGKTAETKFQVLKRFSGKTVLELEPVTGRTNQLRIHCAYIGHPIIGDERYNGRKFSRLCLHAQKLGFYHPSTNIWTEFAIEIPTELKQLAESQDL